MDPATLVSHPALSAKEHHGVKLSAMPWANGSHWIYLEEPAIEVDTNLVENAICPTSLGRRTALFFGDAEAGERSAIIYSIIESCRRHHIEPYTYLRDVLTRLPTLKNSQISEVTPAAWAKAQSKPTAITI